MPATLRSLLVTLCVLPALAGGATAEGMSFRWVGNGGNCAQCSWIQAEGDITDDTPAAFTRFVADQTVRGFDVRNDLVVLDSVGGSVTAAVDLGEAFRKAGILTSVGSAQRDKTLDDAFDLAPGKCLSACFFAFAGGQRRTLEPKAIDGSLVKGSVLGIHRFTAAAIGQSVVSAQQLSGMLSSYLSRMGIDPAILAVGAAVPDTPPGNMHALSAEEAVRYRVVNMGLPAPAWSLQRSKDGAGLMAALKGDAESDAGAYDHWSCTITLGCRRGGDQRFLLAVQIVSDNPFPPGNTFVSEVSNGFTFGLRWATANGARFMGMAATRNDPRSLLLASPAGGDSAKPAPSTSSWPPAR